MLVCVFVFCSRVASNTSRSTPRRTPTTIYLSQQLSIYPNSFSKWLATATASCTSIRLVSPIYLSILLSIYLSI